MNDQPPQEAKKMGALDNGGKAAVGIIETFKSNPLLLAILITNLALLVFVFYTESQHNARSDTVGAIVQTLFDRCLTLTHPAPGKTSLELPENTVQNSIKSGGCN